MADIISSLWLRVCCHLCASLPLLYGCYLAIRTAMGDSTALGADPAEELMSYLGEWGLIGLAATLTVTPIQRQAPKLRLIRYRRALGLWTFTYIVLHLVFYVVVISGLDLSTLITDITERPFIILGALGFLMLLPLAITSTLGWQRQLGRNWRRLHRLVYAVAIAGLLHFFLQVRSDYGEFVFMAVIILGLLAYRLPIKKLRGLLSIFRSSD